MCSSVHRSPIIIYRSSNKNTFRVCSSEENTGQNEAGDTGDGQSPTHNDGTSLRIQCGWSKCDFKIQVYKFE